MVSQIPLMLPHLHRLTTSLFLSSLQRESFAFVLLPVNASALCTHGLTVRAPLTTSPTVENILVADLMIFVFFLIN